MHASPSRARWRAVVLGAVAGLVVASMAVLSETPVLAGPSHSHGQRPVVTKVLPGATSTETTTPWVKVRGHNFRHVRSVWFGAQRGTRIRVPSHDRLWVVAPHHTAGRVRVRVVSGAGTSARSRAAHFTYRELPPTALSAEVSSRGPGRTGAIALGWRPSRSFDAQRLVIRRAAGRVAPASPHDGTLVKRLSATRTSWTDPTVQVGKHYAYAFFSRSSSGVFSRPRKLVTWIPVGTWSSRSIDPLQGEPWHVSCVASGFCAANDSTGKVLTFDGRSWSDPATAPRVGGPVACASASFCIAGGGGFSTYDGSSWSSRQPLGSGLQGTIEDPSCAPGTTTCFAIQQGGDYPRLLRYDGTSWSVAATPNGMTHLSCPTPTYCMGLSSQGVVTYDHGTLTTTSLGANDLPIAVSCGAEADCIVMGWILGQGQATAVHHLHGGSWQTTTLAGQMEDVSCTSPTWCLADTVNGTATYTFDGSDWSSAAPRGAYAVSLSCGNPTTCVAVVGSSRSAVTPVQDDVYLWNGSSWTSSLPDPERGGLTDVSCPTTTFCAAVDQAGDALTYDGSTWSVPQLVEPHPYTTYDHLFGRVSCPTPSFCAAFFDNGYVTTFDGSTWAPSSQIDDLDYVEPKFPSPGRVSIDCASATSCVAIDRTDVLTFDGTSWTAPTGLDRTGVDDVSCPSAQRCVAVDEGGQSLVYNGHRWSSWMRDRLGKRQLDAARISCPTTTYCLAVNGTRSSVWDGAHWTRTVTVQHGPVSDLPTVTWFGVSCSAAATCTAYDTQGRVYDFDGSAWSAGVVVAVHVEGYQVGPLAGLSCGAPGWCRAVSPQFAYSRGG